MDQDHYQVTFSFFLGGTLEFRFGSQPKFCIYLSTSHGKSAEDAEDRARDQARYLENRFQDYFDRSGLELANKEFNWEGANSTAEFEAPSRVDAEKRITIQDGKFWIDKSYAYPEMGVRTIKQAERQFMVPDQLDEIRNGLQDVQDYLYSVEKRLADLQQLKELLVEILRKEEQK